MLDGSFKAKGTKVTTFVAATTQCGDNIVDRTPPANEECDPPAAGTCDQYCQLAPAVTPTTLPPNPACGNGIVEPGEECYEGQVVGEFCRDKDIVVNPTRAKKLSNMRTTGSDENIILKPARKMTLEQALEYIEEDELVEVTPQNIRLRKDLLTEHERRKANRKSAQPVEV